MANQLSGPIGRITRKRNPAPTAKSAERTSLVRSRRIIDIPTMQESQTITLISNVLKSASAHPSRSTDWMIREASPFTQPRVRSAANNSPRDTWPAIGDTAVRAVDGSERLISIGSVFCWLSPGTARTTMPRLLVPSRNELRSQIFGMDRAIPNARWSISNESREVSVSPTVRAWPESAFRKILATSAGRSGLVDLCGGVTSCFCKIIK